MPGTVLDTWDIRVGGVGGETKIMAQRVFMLLGDLLKFIDFT